MHPQQLKKLFISGSCVAIAIYAASTSTQAKADTSYDGFYITAIGGLAIPTSDPKINDIGGTGISGKISYYMPFQSSTPFDAGLALGYKYGPLRLEIEGVYIHAPMKHFKTNNGITFDKNNSRFDGKTILYGALGNIYYDFDQSGDSGHLYIGGGIGYGHVQEKLSSNAFSVNESSSHFILQGIIGWAYNFSSSVSMSIDYRYLTTISDVKPTSSLFGTSLVNLTFSYYVG